MEKTKEKPKQQKLDGFKDITDQELLEAVEEYEEARDGRMARGQEEQEAHEKLLSLMKRKKIKGCVIDGRTVEIKLAGKEKVKVRRKKESDAD